MMTPLRIVSSIILLTAGTAVSAPIANASWGIGSGTPALSTVGTDLGNLDWGNGSAENADNSAVHATFTGVTLNHGQSLTMTGTFTLLGIVSNPATADAFRIGVFDTAGSGNQNGWLGYWAGNDTPTASGGNLKERDNPNTGLYPSSTGAGTILATYDGTTAYLTNGLVYDFSFSITNSNNQLQITSSIMQGATVIASFSATDFTPQTRAFNRVGFHSANILDTDQVQLRGVQVTSNGDPYTSDTVVNPNDPYPEPVLDPVAGTPNLNPATPNILFLISDDQSYPHASAYQNVSGQGSGYDAPGTADDIFTPGFDRIANEGLLFNRAIMPSPGCSPTRAAILCGAQIWQIREAGTHSSNFPADLTVFPDLFMDAGYDVAHVGKGWAPGTFSASRDENPAGPIVYGANIATPSTGMSSNDYAGAFRQFLANRSPGSPFCFWLGTDEPHRGYQSGSGNNNEMQKFNPAYVQLPGYLTDTSTSRSDMSDYLLEVKWFDYHVQRALFSLTPAELDNTIVIICSDNGMPFPNGKSNIRPGGIRSPLAIRWPNGINNPGRLIENWVSLIDVAPTILKAAGIPVPSQMSGADLAPIFESSENGEVSAFSRSGMMSGRERHTNARPLNASYPGRVLFKDHYCLIWNAKPDRWPAGDPPGGVIYSPGYFDCDSSPSLSELLAINSAGNTTTTDARGKTLMSYFNLMAAKRPEYEFYDIATDPDALDNLIGNPAHAATIAAMKTEMQARLLADQDPRVLGFGDIIDSYPRFAGAHASDFVDGKYYNEWTALAFQSLSTLTPTSPAGLITHLADADTGLTITSSLATDGESSVSNWMAGGGPAGASLAGNQASFADQGWATLFNAADSRGTWGHRSSLVEIDPATPNPLVYSPAASADEILIEAENFSRRHDSATHQWTVSGTGLTASPDSGANVGNPAFLTDSPRADYFINFAKPGYYEVWVRGAGSDGASDSCHLALNGVLVETLDYAALANNGTPAWTSTSYIGNRLGVWVRSAGMHVLSLYMREDGATIDKILLTLDFEYNPNTDALPSTPSAGTAVSATPSINLDPGLSAVDRDVFFSLNAAVTGGSPLPWTEVSAAGGYKLVDPADPASPLSLFDAGDYRFRLGASNATAQVFKDQLLTASTSQTPIESFRSTFFGTTANTGTAADTFDADHDRIPNLLEFLLGGDPTDPSSPGSALAPDGPNQFLLNLRSGGFGDPAAGYFIDGFLAQLSWSDDLLTFTPDPARFLVAPAPVAPPGLESWSVAFANGALPHEFLRLKASRPQTSSAEVK